MTMIPDTLVKHGFFVKHENPSAALGKSGHFPMCLTFDLYIPVWKSSNGQTFGKWGENPSVYLGFCV